MLEGDADCARWHAVLPEERTRGNEWLVHVVPPPLPVLPFCGVGTIAPWVADDTAHQAAVTQRDPGGRASPQGSGHEAPRSGIVDAPPSTCVLLWGLFLLAFCTHETDPLLPPVASLCFVAAPQVVDVIHPGRPPVSKADLRENLAKLYKVKDSKCIVLFGFKTGFGGGRSSGFCLIYDSQEEQKRYEPRYRLARNGLAEPKPARRSAYKEKKARVKRTWGTGRRAQLHKQKKAEA